MSPNQESPESPCNGECEMDDTSQYCLGCFRTMDEVVMWSMLETVEKQEILVLLEQRKQDWK